VGRRLGQHYLVRESILEKIAHATCGEHTPAVVEIGPGKGALTKRLLLRSDHVIAVEVDPYLVHYLRQKFRENDRLSLVESDVLKTDLGQWGPAAIAGNLPYYITSPIIANLFRARNWTRAVFLVQKEVAERVTALPGSRDYGYLTVFVALHSHAELLFPVSRAAFAPPPKVESAVVRLTPRNPMAEWGLGDPGAFLSFAGLAFQHKRKTLRNNLRTAFPHVDGLPEASLRAEQLAVAELVGLYRKLAAKIEDERQPPML
jgi:16S rRNA (adenine1518-N6/adenine1519-N6)-dimethyltransferase